MNNKLFQIVSWSACKKNTYIAGNTPPVDLVLLRDGKIPLIPIAKIRSNEHNFCSSNLKYTCRVPILDFPLDQMNIFFVHQT